MKRIIQLVETENGKRKVIKTIRDVRKIGDAEAEAHALRMAGRDVTAVIVGDWRPKSDYYPRGK